MTNTSRMLLIIASALAITSCTAEKENDTSTDLAAFENTLILNFPATSVQWERYGWPENDGGFLASNADALVIIAEFTASESTWFARTQSKRLVRHVVPHSDRDWLSAPFKRILAMNSEALRDKHCRDYETRQKPDYQQLSGFVCQADGRFLIYLSRSLEGVGQD